MVEDNIRDFTVNWIVFGLLFTSLLSFAIVFMFNNNPDGFGDDADYILNTTYTSSNSKLLELPSETDELLNITSKTNPEASFLGSRDTVATSYGSYGTAKGYWETSKLMLRWVFSGDVGKVLLAILSGLIGFIAFYFIVKFIRTGT